jgi:hypothetical protein
LDSCVWDATHIVIVTQADKTDIAVEIVDSLKGDLKKGDRITIPDLAEFALENERAIKKAWLPLVKEGPNPPTHVNGVRMILFLIKSEEKEEPGQTAAIAWKPANLDWHEIRVSMAWIEQDQVFAFRQEMNPGASELLAAGMSGRRMHDRVVETVKHQNALFKAIAQSDQTKIAEALLPLLHMDSSRVGSYALRTLRKSGKQVLPVLVRVLSDEGSARWYHDAVEEIVKTEEWGAGPLLTGMLDCELSFWRMRGPSINPHWCGIDDEELEFLHDRCRKVDAVLMGLRKLRFAGCQKEVADFKDTWLRLPQLFGLGPDGLVETCDKILADID